MLQFLTTFGDHNINIECTETVHIFHWLWNGRTFCLNLWQFELFFQETDTSSQNWYHPVLLQLHFINTAILECFILDINWKSLKSINMLFFDKVKQSKLVITTRKLPSSKVYHALNNALGICVHEKHYQVLPTQMVPICENFGLGPWTIHDEIDMLTLVKLELLTGTWHAHCANKVIYKWIT